MPRLRTDKELRDAIARKDVVLDIQGIHELSEDIKHPCKMVLETGDRIIVNGRVLRECRVGRQEVWLNGYEEDDNGTIKRS